MLTITESQVREHLPMEDAIRLLREAFGEWRMGRARNQPRRRLVLPSGAVLHQLAGASGRYFGTKVYSTHPLHGAYFHVLLYEAETAKPLALIDANWLGQIRTGAASGLATDLLANPEASTLGVIGTGFQSASQMAAIRAVRPIRSVRVWGRDPEKRKRFADAHDAVAVATAEEAVRDSDVIVTMTSAKDPVLEAEWVAPEAHVNAAGSNRATHRELPPELIERAALIAVDDREQAKIESGDLILANFQWSDPRLVELKDLAEWRKPDGITIFKSNGLGLEDIAVAGHIYERVALT